MKTPQQIKDASLERFPISSSGPTNDLRFGYIEGATQMQKDLLESASKGFDECFSKYATESNLHHEFDAHYFWQACALSKMKEIQEKDAEINKLKKEFEKQYQQGCSTQADLNKANEMLFHLNNIETKYQEAVKDIDFLMSHASTEWIGSWKLEEIKTKYGLDKKEGWRLS